jgi:NADPH:quinone reductase-like Zn-dependent oxidoreductase
VVDSHKSEIFRKVIQITSYLGFGPIITTASLHNAKYLKSLGATHVIDRHEDTSADIKTILPSTPVDLIFDAVHWPVTQSEVDLLAPGGVMISIGNVPETGLDISENKRVSFFYGIVEFQMELSKSMYKLLTKFLENGVIKVSVHSNNALNANNSIVTSEQPNRFKKLEGGLAGITAGLDKMEKGEISGIKLVVSPSETPAL